MWKPSEIFLTRQHIIGSIATIICGLSIVIVSLAPSYFPGVYKLLVDDRVSFIIPYLLFIALGEAVFSLWFFLFRK